MQTYLSSGGGGDLNRTASARSAMLILAIFNVFHKSQSTESTFLPNATTIMPFLHLPFRMDDFVHEFAFSFCISIDWCVQYSNNQLTYLSYSFLEEHKASTVFLHLLRSCATFCACPIESPISSSSVWIVLRQVIFGRPLFLFPGGVQFRATFGI